MTSETPSKYTWTVPPKADVQTAIDYFWERHMHTLPMITIQFHLHNPSAYKKRVLLHTHALVTNLTAAIIEHFHESPSNPRDDGILATLVPLKHKRTFGNPSASSIIKTLFEGTAMIKADVPLASPIRDGVYRDVAEMLTSWFSLLIQHPVFTAESFISLESFYRDWQTAIDRYDAAMSTIVSLGLSLDELEREPAYKLIRRSKREARWMDERIISDEKLTELEHHITDILDPLNATGDFVDHAWAVPRKARRTLRENWFLIRNTKGAKTQRLLRTMGEHELHLLHDEVTEIRSYYEHADTIIERCYSDVLKAHLFKSTMSPQQKLAVVLEDFFYHKPRAFPSVSPVRILGDRTTDMQLQRMVDETTQIAVAEDDYEARYRHSMRWFELYRGDGDILDRFLSTEQETKTVQQLFHTLRMLQPPAVQPIRFNGTMRPFHRTDGVIHSAQWRYFALLYDRCSLRLTLAVIVHHANTDLVPPHEREKPRFDQQVDYAQRRATNPLYYVNFPTVPFVPPPSQPVLLFDLACGEYQHEWVKKLIKYQADQQQRLHTASDPAHMLHSHEILPTESPVCSGRLACVYDDGQPTFYFHAHMRLLDGPNGHKPQRVLAVCAYDDLYSYAVLERDGRVCAVGDVPIPVHVDQRCGAHRSRNTVYAVAQAILQVALRWDAWIGIEDTSKRHKGKGQGRATHSLRRLKVPPQMLFMILSYKTQALGLMPPRKINNISAHDCPWCYCRNDPKRPINHAKLVRYCAGCCVMHTIDPEHREAVTHCPTCAKRYTKKSPLLWVHDHECPTCHHHPEPTHHARALVAGQRMLNDMIQHRINSIKKRQKQTSQPTNDAV